MSAGERIAYGRRNNVPTRKPIFYFADIERFADVVPPETATEEDFSKFLAQFPLTHTERSMLYDRFKCNMTLEQIGREYRLIGGAVYAQRFINRALQTIKKHLEAK